MCVRVNVRAHTCKRNYCFLHVIRYISIIYFWFVESVYRMMKKVTMDDGHTITMIFFFCFTNKYNLFW